MTNHRPFSELATKIDADPVRRARAEQHRRAMEDALELARLHEELGLAERKDADALDESPPEDSDIAFADEPYLSTLLSYVEALGGRLEINAVFPDATLTLLRDRRWAVQKPVNTGLREPARDLSAAQMR
jgi:hypothetical protein